MKRISALLRLAEDPRSTQFHAEAPEDPAAAVSHEPQAEKTEAAMEPSMRWEDDGGLAVDSDNSIAVESIIIPVSPVLPKKRSRDFYFWKRR